MTQKTYYYRFNKFDKTFIAMIAALCLVFYVGQGDLVSWTLFVGITLVWFIKNFLKHKAVVITDKWIKIDYSQPLPWKDIKDAEIKVVNLCGHHMKVLALTPKKGIKYNYSFMQKHNANFGPFPIPLYGILTADDEKEIVQIVKKHVKIK